MTQAVLNKLDGYSSASRLGEQMCVHLNLLLKLDPAPKKK